MTISELARKVTEYMVAENVWLTHLGKEQVKKELRKILNEEIPLQQKLEKYCVVGTALCQLHDLQLWDKVLNVYEDLGNHNLSLNTILGMCETHLLEAIKESLGLPHLRVGITVGISIALAYNSKLKADGGDKAAGVLFMVEQSRKIGYRRGLSLEEWWDWMQKTLKDNRLNYQNKMATITAICVLCLGEQENKIPEVTLGWVKDTTVPQESVGDLLAQEWKSPNFKNKLLAVGKTAYTELENC